VEFSAAMPVGFTQPFVLAIGLKNDPKEYHFIVDSQSLSLNNDIGTFSRLFFPVFVFNVDYFPKLLPFYNFFEVCILKKGPKVFYKTTFGV